MKRAWKQFNVYPGRQNPYSRDWRLYFRVMIFDTAEAQARAYRTLKPRVKDPESAVASVIPCRPAEPGSRRKLIGFVLYNRRELQAEPVCHEAGHMTREYLKRLRYSCDLDAENNKREERFCYTLGRIAQQVQNGIAAAGLMKA